MGKFVLKQTSSGYRFDLKADNGQIILTCEIYSSKSGRLNGVESVKTHSPKDSNYDRRTSTNSKYYFNLKASNGQVIGTSEMYETASGRDNGVESVKSNARKAEVVEE